MGQATQTKSWEILQKNHGIQAEAILLSRLRASIDQRGTLDVLRHGIELLGLRQPLTLAQYKPALAMNPDILARYSANRLRVVRQVRYSLHNENAIDLVLFLNGIPVATVELKSDFTQSVEDAVDQYRFDREPRPKGQGSAEPLLSFPNGALVHFAVSQMEVMMTRRLEGAATSFLPFNRSDHGASGNPPYTPTPQPTPIEGEGVLHGHRTAYLWEQIWQRDSWLEILGRYLVAQKDKKNQIRKIIFPRFHQLDATRKLVVCRLLQRYKAAQEKLRIASVKEDGKAATDAQNELNALILFKHDIGAFQRLYAFLSQIFDYGNTAIEKRYLFFERLLPLLEFGREREVIDVSKIVLTHHKLKGGNKRALPLGDGKYQKLQPMTGPGTGSIHEKEKAYLTEIITKVNDLFQGELSENDKLVFVNNVKGKMLESQILVKQASNNSKEQFANSPDLSNELMNAIIDAFAALNTMSKQALDSEKVRSGLRDILMGPAKLYEALRERGESRIP